MVNKHAAIQPGKKYLCMAEVWVLVLCRCQANRLTAGLLWQPEKLPAALLGKGHGLGEGHGHLGSFGVGLLSYDSRSLLE